MNKCCIRGDGEKKLKDEAYKIRIVRNCSFVSCTLSTDFDFNNCSSNFRSTVKPN